jgi:hypothetical protein
VSWLQVLGQTFNPLIRGVVRAGKAAVAATAPVASKLMQVARDTVDELARRIQRARGDAGSEQEVVERQLQEVNARIARLRKAYRDNGRLTDREKAEWQRLKARRAALIQDLDDLEAGSFAEDVVDPENKYQSTTVTEQNAHLIDMLTGQTTYGKKCRVCQRAMTLQWDRRVGTPGIRDFFWGCSGWYIVYGSGRHACRHIERLSNDDFRIFMDVTRPEFQMKADEVRRRILDPGRRQRLRQALDAIRAQNKASDIGLSHYRCPVHGESLRLQRKSASNDDFLDEYFLGCPRWLPQNQGCNFLIKLKSPGRITGVLQEAYGIDAGRVLDG